MRRSVWCTTEFVGFHQWESASGDVEYLKYPHRHLFKVYVEVAVDGSEREVEFHTLKKRVGVIINRLSANRQDTPSQLSCEAMAGRIAVDLAFERFRVLVVSVSEDGECGGTVRLE